MTDSHNSRTPPRTAPAGMHSVTAVRVASSGRPLVLIDDPALLTLLAGHNRIKARLGQQHR